MPFNLSNVLFILTANVSDTIPSALLDRMEVIRLSGYTVEEKLIIAEKHLFPRKKKENGLIKRSINISSGAMDSILFEYTQEAGLRNLERNLDAICRKLARKIAGGKKGTFSITKQNLKKYLGQPKFFPELDQEESQAGLVTGLAWTEAGGEHLYIEASLMSGKGELVITGQIGDVMQESAKAALTYVKSNMKALSISSKAIGNNDIHIHVPAGAIPKDGPSAGVAIAIAMISALTSVKVDSKVAMTGEITLRGRVLPIGGLKEKALGAVRAGIKRVIIPEKNKNDLFDIPKSVKKKIEFIAVKDLNQVIEIALIKDN